MGASSLGVTGARHADPSRDAPPATKMAVAAFSFSRWPRAATVTWRSPIAPSGQAASRIALDRSRRRVGSWLRPVSGMEAPRTGDGAAAMGAHLVVEVVAPRALGWLPRALDRISSQRKRCLAALAGQGDGGRSAARSPPQAGASPWAPALAGEPCRRDPSAAESLCSISRRATA
jgi:hypothetical protein